MGAGWWRKTLEREKLSSIIGRLFVYVFFFSSFWKLVGASLTTFPSQAEWTRVICPLLGMCGLWGVAGVGCKTGRGSLLIPGLVAIAIVTFGAFIDFLKVFSSCIEFGHAGNPDCLQGKHHPHLGSYYRDHKRYCDVISAVTICVHSSSVLFFLALWGCIHSAWSEMEKRRLSSLTLNTLISLHPTQASNPPSVQKKKPAGQWWSQSGKMPFDDYPLKTPTITTEKKTEEGGRMITKGIDTDAPKRTEKKEKKKAEKKPQNV